MRRLVDILYRGVMAVCATMLAVMVLVVAFQIIGRYVPFIPRALWTEEISRMCLVWLVFLGAAAGVRTSEHFLIDLIPAKASERTLRVVATLGLALVATVAIALLIGGASFVQTGAGRTSTTTGVSLVYSFVAPLVSAVLMLVFTVQVWWETMRDPRRDAMQLGESELVEVTGHDPGADVGDASTSQTANGVGTEEGRSR